MSYLRTLSRQSAEVSCGHCGTVFTVDRDEDGGASIETWPCCSDTRTERLCDECRHVCEACGCSLCRECLSETIDGLMCKVCLDSLAEQGEDLLRELQESDSSEWGVQQVCRAAETGVSAANHER